MAEFGATVVAFLSLAAVIRPLHTAVSDLRDAPDEAIFFRNQLTSLQSVVSGLERLRERIPADIFCEHVCNALDHVRKPLQQDVAALQTLLGRAGNASSLRGRVWWCWKGGQLNQLCRRLDEYRALLTTLLVLLHSEYLPLHHELLARTTSSTTNIERITTSIDDSLRRHPILETSLQNLSRQQKAHNDNINRQVAMMAKVMAGVPHNSMQHLEYNWEGPKMRHKSITRFEYDFHFVKVIMSWGPLRRKRKRSLDADFSEDELVEGQQPPGFGFNVDIVPASWLSQRGVVGGWSRLRDHRGSSNFYPRLSFPVTVPADSDVMYYAASNDLPALRNLFSSRKASVTDRVDAGWTPLHMAAAAGSLEACKYLLAHGADVTSTGHLGLLPLHLAATYGHLDVIKILVDNEGDPEAYNQHGFNAIFEVLHSPFISNPALKATIMIWLLQQQHFIVDVNAQDYQGNSILGWFVQRYPSDVKLLLDHDARVNTRAHDGSTPLHKAAATGSLESVRLLIQKGADLSIIENDGSTALVRAAERGHFAIVQHLTSRSQDIVFDDKEPLIKTAYEPVQLLCKQGMPGPSDVINQIIKTCSSSKAARQLKGSEIWFAAQQGYWSVVSKLQEAGVDPYRKNEYGYRALVRLVYKGDLQGVNALIQSGSQTSRIDDDLVLSLTRAAAAGHNEIVSHLLSLTSPDFFDNASGSKALVAAAKNGRLETITLLLPTVPEHCWYRALVRASEHGHLHVVNFFLEQGVHPTRSGVGGDTAVVRAARYGHVEIVKRLLVAGADPNQHGWFGYSALVRAAYNNHLEVVDCLLVAGAVPDLPEISGDRAIVRAVRQGHRRVAEKLEEAGARPVDDDTRENKDGPSKALLKAAIYNYETILVQLLWEGANPNTVEADGNTPMSRACENGHLSIVTLLLKAGAMPYALSKSTVSPVERAAEAGHLKVVRTLLKAYHKIPIAEKRKALFKSSEKGHSDITALLVEDGVDLQSEQSPSGIGGMVHFYVLDHWMKSMTDEKLAKNDLNSPSIHNIERTDSEYPMGPPSWGYDGSLVARFRWPRKIVFYSDLTSSTMHHFFSSVLLQLAYVLRLSKRFIVLISAVAALIVGIAMLGIESLVRTSGHSIGAA